MESAFGRCYRLDSISGRSAGRLGGMLAVSGGKAGRKITRCIPVTAVELPRERRPLYLYGKGKSALFLFREEHVQESRILNTADADKNYKYLSVIS